ncbi:MAG: hypothetical protein MK160_14795 [Rhodobacteraceae bacterium]|nr:hypothetical protein [Paracoccaceae bacterium]
MTEETPDTPSLAPFFEAAQNAPMEPSGGLLERIEADALAMMPTPDAPVAVRHRGIFAQVLECVGGWPAVSGLVAATAAGVWIGASPSVLVPDGVAVLLWHEAGVVTSDALEPLSGFDGLLVEG